MRNNCYIKKSLWIALFFFLITTAGLSAHTPPKNTSPPLLLQQAMSDTGFVKINEQTAAGGEELSLDDEESEALPLDEVDMLIIDGEEVPAHALYKTWVNNLVNPYQVRLVDKPDTTVIDLSNYSYPLSKTKIFPRQITSDFGFRNGYAHHYGIDLKLNTGDSVFSAFDGMVRIAMRSRSYGNYVVIRHYNGLETVYGHLSKIDVKINQLVKAGDLIGKGGSTGRSTGPHLHYELRYLGVPIPPRNIVDFENYSAKNDTLLLSSEDFNYIKEIEKIRIWVVRSGDTLSRIAQRTGVSVSRLCQLNNIKSTSILRIGQRIRYT